jgi:hypothetical protein
MMRNLLAAFVMALAAEHVVSATPGEALLDFAIRHVGKFSSEMAEPAAPLVLRIAADDADFYAAQYKAREGLLLHELPPTVRDRQIAVSCKKLGSYVGATAIGAKANVTRRSCIELQIVDAAAGVTLGDTLCKQGQAVEECRFGLPVMRSPMSPDQFRALKRLGAWLEIEFVPGMGVDQEVATKQTFRSTPRLDWPYEDNRTVLTVRGTIRAVRVVAKSDGAEIGKFFRESAGR